MAPTSPAEIPCSGRQGFLRFDAVDVGAVTDLGVRLGLHVVADTAAGAVTPRIPGSRSWASSESSCNAPAAIQPEARQHRGRDLVPACPEHVGCRWLSIPRPPSDARKVGARAGPATPQQRPLSYTLRQIVEAGHATMKQTSASHQATPSTDPVAQPGAPRVGIALPPLAPGKACC